MAVRRLHWLGQERRRRLTSRLSVQLGEWLSAWSVDPSWLRLGECDSDVAEGDERTWRRLASAHGALWIGVPEEQMAGFGGHLAAAPTIDDFALGLRVGRRALDALLARWADVPGTRSEVDVPDAGLFAARFGASTYRLHGKGFDAIVLLDHDLVEALVPSASAPRDPLASRDAAFGDEAVRLDVVLDLGSVELADASSVQVGDVLLSDIGFDALFRLTYPDRRPLSDARLYRHGARLALQVLPLTSTKRMS